MFAAARLSDHAFIRVPATVIVEFFRAVPVLIMMVFAYFGFYAQADWIDTDLRPLLG